ncbi:MAG: hypothetical protein ABI885_29110 [Gammaproteobacteria bacterium]
MAKVQGEGDYESARRYNADTRKFVKKAGAAATKRPTGGVDKGALVKAKSKAKAGGQDKRDAAIFSTLEKKRAKSKSKSAGARSR